MIDTIVSMMEHVFEAYQTTVMDPFILTRRL